MLKLYLFQNFFLPLDLTVSEWWNKARFIMWYAEEVQTQMESEVRTEDIMVSMVDLRLTVIKPLHAT